jgi:hypothetical protein
VLGSYVGISGIGESRLARMKLPDMRSREIPLDRRVVTG